ncbi:MAG: glycosyltransferase [Candidatus Eisenbacteria sp.]|nr:glycosyltransferase [Candidatus Eisenbacteria bacterium]
MKVALVQDWLTGMRGGEKCLEVLCEMYPDADIFTLVHHAGSVSPTIERMPIRTSFIQLLPGSRRRHQIYLPLFPMAIERFDFSGYDLIVSTSHCVAKGARRNRGVHVCYCHTPMRYVWEFFDEYFADAPGGALSQAFLRAVVAYLRRWDLRTLDRVDHFVANSENVAGRIRKHYGREAEVIYPPVETDFFTPGGDREEFYLVVSALVPYKRVDLIVDAFRHLRRPLVVVGKGPEERSLRDRAPDWVSFEGWVDPEALREYYRRCRALVFAGLEDFGIGPVEAQACGTPVVAYGQGGVLESVRGSWVGEGGEENQEGTATGVFFVEQTPAALAAAVRSFERMEFDRDALRSHALGFSREKYRARMTEAIRRQLEGEATPETLL